MIVGADTVTLEDRVSTGGTASLLLYSVTIDCRRAPVWTAYTILPLITPYIDLACSSSADELPFVLALVTIGT